MKRKNKDILVMAFDSEKERGVRQNLRLSPGSHDSDRTGIDRKTDSNVSDEKGRPAEKIPPCVPSETEFVGNRIKKA